MRVECLFPSSAHNGSCCPQDPLPSQSRNSHCSGSQSVMPLWGALQRLCPPPPPARPLPDHADPAPGTPLTRQSPGEENRMGCGFFRLSLVVVSRCCLVSIWFHPRKSTPQAKVAPALFARLERAEGSGTDVDVLSWTRASLFRRRGG